MLCSYKSAIKNHYSVKTTTANHLTCLTNITLRTASKKDQISSVKLSKVLKKLFFSYGLVL